MRRLLALLMVSAFLSGAPKISRSLVSSLEKNFDRRLDREVLDGDQFALIGLTRGMYVDGFGVVYAAEVVLASAPGISPFHPEVTKEDKERLRQKKMAKLPLLRKTMRQMMIDSAGSLDGLPDQENFVLGVTMHRHPWEDPAGLPSQIVMQAQKRALIEMHTGKRAVNDAAIRVQEF